MSLAYGPATMLIGRRQRLRVQCLYAFVCFAHDDIHDAGCRGCLSPAKFCTLTSLTLAELHVSVLTTFIKLIKLIQNLMKLLPNHIMV